MKLIITQPELTAIVKDHVAKTVQMRDGSDINIEFTATRGDDGITATIDIPYTGLGGLVLPKADKTPAPAPAPKAKAEPAAPKAKTPGPFGDAAAAPPAAESNANEAAQDAAASPDPTAGATEQVEAAQAASQEASEAPRPTTGKSLFDT